jgi:hypothetical protein
MAAPMLGGVISAFGGMHGIFDSLHTQEQFIQTARPPLCVRHTAASRVAAQSGGIPVVTAVERTLATSKDRLRRLIQKCRPPASVAPPLLNVGGMLERWNTHFSTTVEQEVFGWV